MGRRLGEDWEKVGALMKGKSHRKGFYISFGHNTRSKLGFTDGECAALTLKGASGKRLTLHQTEGYQATA